MRESLTKIGFLLLVAVLVIGGLTGCERKAPEREPEDIAESDAESADAAAPEDSDALDAAPQPGATVVSATTPSTVVEQEPTPGAIVEPAEPSEEPSTELDAQPVTESEGSEGAATEPATDSAPTEATAPATDADANYVIHTVKKGETLSSIATKYGVTVDAITQANNLANASVIKVGQELKIPKNGQQTQPPAAGSGKCRWKHKVKKGEWVYQIARSYGVSPQAIIRASNLKNPSLVQPGTVLCIP